MTEPEGMLPSLPEALAAISGERDRQLQHFEGLDTKAGVLLGFDGVLVALARNAAFVPRLIGVRARLRSRAVVGGGSCRYSGSSRSEMMAGEKGGGMAERDVATGRLQQEATRLGVCDALVFRRLSVSRWAHLGGLGRGRGWAGLVDVEAGQDPLMERVPIEVGGVHVFAHAAAERVLGPYYAVGGALVRVSNDVVVLLGNPTEALAAPVSTEALCHLATRLDAVLEDIAPSKRLGDELEVLHAVRAVTTGPALDLRGTLQHVLAVAVESLSCEVGLLRDGAGRTVASSSWSGVDVDDPEVGAALDALHQRAAGASLCIQDTDADPVLAPLGRAQGVRSVLAITIPAPVGGVLVVAHTTAGPRGFTNLCQQLGRQVADAASVVAHTASLREDLRAVADEQSTAARRDALTGLGNRLAWDEALTAAQDAVDAGGCATIITIDVDGLKQVNDTCGHEAGDGLLRDCADILREHGRDVDVCVRLGGDEFALLLPLAGSLATSRLVSLRASLGGVTSCEASVAASVGSASVYCGGSVGDAAREADAAMYAAKRARRPMKPNSSLASSSSWRQS